MKYREKYKPIKFPQDEQKHNHVIEWWYFNGNLKSKSGRLFSYMNTLFAAKPKKVKIPFLSNIPLKTLYFSHHLLTDNKANKFQYKINPVCWVNHNSFTKPLLWAQYDNACLIEETSQFNYHIVNDFIDLNLEASKQPLLLNKTGFLDLGMKTTYYYSLTNLKTKGIIKVKNKWLEVEGLSWMDHQWAQGPLMRGDKWTWFSIQLNNGIDMLCFVYGDEVKTFHASLIDENGKVEFTDDLILKAKGNKYHSKETGSDYYLNYEIYLPDWQINLEVKSFNRQQEMIFGTINYWEGGIEVQGKIKNKKVKGLGFMELVGSPMKKSVYQIYLNKIKKEILNNPIKSFSNELAKQLKVYK
ncbi:MAG: hypothetical protein GF365_04410 [Candidatus Buchananbacteria bacterium]|nr:hypothetical protein [Candidatus Buchananbacteria bacterium]